MAPVEQPTPSMELLQEEYLLVEAWKKTAAHLRAHNWFADTLAIDRAAVELPRFLDEVADRLASPTDYMTHPLQLVPAPKSHAWNLRSEEGETLWTPVPLGEGLEPRIRPLAHVDLKDQVAATAIMLCLADRVETRQGDPTGRLTDPEHRRRVLSYGNRLLCDEQDERLLYRWGTASLYRGYFEDYRAFVERPAVAAEAASDGGSRIVIVQSDLRNFYDRVRPALLSERLNELKRAGDPDDFFELAARALKWVWASDDEPRVRAYANQEEISGFDDIALPQGLAAAGFFSNVVLLGFDGRLRGSIGAEIFDAVTLVDVARYVDDLRIVLSVASPAVQLDKIEHETKAWLDSILEPEQDLEVADDKTHATEFGLRSERPIVRQGERMTRIQKAVSGGFDVAGGEAILEAIRGLMQSQRLHPERPSHAQAWPLTPVANVPDTTVARFGAARFRRVYRWLRPLSDEEAPSYGNFVGVGGDGLGPNLDFPTKTRNELDADAQVFAAELIRTWVADPSNIRLLRIAFDLWPSAEALREVLKLLMPYVTGDNDDNINRIAQYCLAEIFRAGATETGIVDDEEASWLEADAYREVLKGAALQILELTVPALPWYVRQQALLFLATMGSPLPQGPEGDSRLEHYTALLRFLEDPALTSSTTEFVTLSVLARRCYKPDGAAELVAQHLTKARMIRLARTDPEFALELLKFDWSLVQLLPDYVARDLCKSGAVPGECESLAALVLQGRNPFRDELSLLQFAKKVLEILRRGQLGLVMPVDLEVDIEDDDKWGVRRGEFSLRLHKRRYMNGSIYSPPSWCRDQERWRFQLGYLLRFILTESEDFAASVRPKSSRASRGGSYRPVGVPWKVRRYGFLNAHQAFGDRWLPITEWTTKLLIDLLAWPGARRPEYSWINEGIHETSKAIQRRIDELLKSQGPAKSELLLKLEPEPPLDFDGRRPLRAAVVQMVLPQQNWFQEEPIDFSPERRKQMRKHLTAALSAVRSSLRLRKTHAEGVGGLDLLILPELSVHLEDLHILRQFAISERTIVLAGLVYHAAREDDGQPFVNSAVWLIPERNRVRGGQVRIIEQGKRHLAKDELKLHVRPFRNSQWLIGHPWSREPDDNRLWLTASVCYDATDFALAADLKGHSDVYVIPALNRDTTTFDQMALALHYHMFQIVILANNGVFGGSNAYVPYKNSYKRRVFHFHGQPQAAIAYVEIDNVDEFLRRADNKKKYKTPPAGLVQGPWH